jgi:hypothetical protein
MPRALFRAAACLIVWAATGGIARGADVEALLERMRAALLPAARMEAAFVFEIEDDAGDTVRWTGELERDGDARTLRMRFQSPRDLAGLVFTASQAREGLDTLTLYLPSVRRTRTIKQNLRGTSFLGSDFNYEDVGLEQLQYQSHRLAGEGDVDGRPCTRVESKPSQSLWYGRIVRCIDREDYLPRHTEYFDPAGLPYKVRTLEDVETIATHPTALRIRMRVVPDESESRIALSDVEYESTRD